MSISSSCQILVAAIQIMIVVHSISALSGWYRSERMLHTLHFLMFCHVTQAAWSLFSLWLQ